MIWRVGQRGTTNRSNLMNFLQARSELVSCFLHPARKALGLPFVFQLAIVLHVRLTKVVPVDRLLIEVDTPDF